MDKQEWQEWKQQEVTKEYLKYLKKLKQDLIESWIAGGYTGGTIDETAQLNAKAVGLAQLLDALIDLSYEEVADVE